MVGALLSTAAGITAAVSLGFQSMWPKGQWYGRTFCGLPKDSRMLALTYDDGPNDPHTLHLLQILAKHDVHATFFMIGRYVKQRPDIAREVARAGHVIGNHTFNHPNLIRVSSRETRKELEDCEKALTDAVGEHSALFRPPFGGRRPSTLRVARSLGLDPVMWNMTGYDWRGLPAGYIERKLRNQIRGGSVILLHDGSHQKFGADRAQTVIATDHLLAKYGAEGYRFVTIPQMMQKAASAQPSAFSQTNL
jgi:peptidoglycan/xylan/chitin deacetylase (PgdA/CDA1 family)